MGRSSDSSLKRCGTCNSVKDEEYVCECGSSVQKRNRKRHEASGKHKAFVTGGDKCKECGKKFVSKVSSDSQPETHDDVEAKSDAEAKSDVEAEV